MITLSMKDYLKLVSAQSYFELAQRAYKEDSESVFHWYFGILSENYEKRQKELEQED